MGVAHLNASLDEGAPARIQLVIGVRMRPWRATDKLSLEATRFAGLESLTRPLRSLVIVLAMPLAGTALAGTSGAPTVSAVERVAAGTEWTGPSGYAMVGIPAGSFTMGSPQTEADRDKGEPRHEVTLTHDFDTGRMEVTRALWRSVMASNPSAACPSWVSSTECEHVCLVQGGRRIDSVPRPPHQPGPCGVVPGQCLGAPRHDGQRDGVVLGCPRGHWQPQHRHVRGQAPDPSRRKLEHSRKRGPVDCARIGDSG